MDELLIGGGVYLLGKILMTKKTTELGKAELIYSEGKRHDLYRDFAGYATIGIGHRVEPNEYMPETISDEVVNYLFAVDLADAEKTVNKLVTANITPYQFDALVSFVFNIGETQFGNSTALNRINAGDFLGGAEAMLWYNKAGGEVSDILVNRRKQEATLFLNGEYSPQAHSMVV